MTNTSMIKGFLFTCAMLVPVACGSSNDHPPAAVASAEQAQRAYLGIDKAIDKALNLGMQGFNQATSANISPQTGHGDVQGTLVVGGQVDQGASANKTMRLTTDFTKYEDNVPSNEAVPDSGFLHIIYDAASGGTTDLTLMLANIPNGTFSGTFVQTLHMTGDLQGDVALNLTINGNIQSSATGGIERVPGTTVINGTAQSPYGTYTVNITR